LWHPAVDLAIGCAGWSLPFLVLSGAWAQRGALDVAYAFSLLTLVCNHPHYMATLQRAWSDPERRGAYRFYLVHLAVLLAIAAVAMRSAPLLIPAFFTAYVIWSPWHYSGQNFGLVMLFARRAGAQPPRRLLRAAFLASYVVWLLTVQSRPSTDPYIWSLALPASVVNPAACVMAVAFLVLASVALGRIGERSGWRAILAPLALLSSQTLWFIAPWLLQVAGGRGVSPLYYSTGALAFMHCAQYLWLTSWVAKREAGAHAWHPAPYAALLVVGGIALFTAVPWSSSALFGADLRESTLIVVALVNLHHFILDGVLWRQRDARTAAILFDPVPPPAAAAKAPRQLRPALAWSLAVVLLALAALNALQQYLTRADADADRLALAQRLHPQDTRIDVRRAELLAEARQSAAALQTLAPRLELRAANAAALRLYGALLVADGRYDDALRHLRAVEDSVGLDPPGLVNLGVLLARDGHDEGATAALRAALRLDPAMPAAHLNLAGLCLQGGDIGCALAHYDAFLGSPDVPPDRDYASALLNAASAAQVAQRPALADALRRDAKALATRLGAEDLVDAADRQLASADAPP
jgi:Tfp pilus assembly protein PilF